MQNLNLNETTFTKQDDDRGCFFLTILSFVIVLTGRLCDMILLTSFKQILILVFQLTRPTLLASLKVALYSRGGWAGDILYTDCRICTPLSCIVQAHRKLTKHPRHYLYKT